MSTPNPYQALVTTLHDYSDDDPTVPLADPSTIVPTTNDNPPDDVPICPKPQLIIGTTFIIHGSTEIIRLTNSIDLIDIVEHYDMYLLRDDTFDLIKAKSIHSIIDSDQCSDDTIKHFQDHMSTHLFKVSGFIDPSAKLRPIPSTTRGLQRHYTDLLSFYGDDHHIIPSMILELDFRIRVQPPVHVAPLVHHVAPIIHPIVSTTTTTGTFTGNSPVPPLRITIPDHGTSAST